MKYNKENKVFILVYLFQWYMLSFFHSIIFVYNLKLESVK